MLPSAVRRLIRDFVVRPGGRAVVLAADEPGLGPPTTCARPASRSQRVVDLRETPVRGARGAAPARPRASAARSTATRRVRPARRLGRTRSPRTRCSPRRGRGSSSTPRSASSSRPTCRRASRRSGRVTGEGLEKIDAAPEHEGRGKCFVCVCEDVTTKDVKRAIAEGFDSIELAKRYTTVTMGPCQGRLCQLPRSGSTRRRARAYEAALGTTTARPPWAPVELGPARRPAATSPRSAPRSTTATRRRARRCSGRGRGGARTSTARRPRTRSARCTSRSA